MKNNSESALNSFERAKNNSQKRDRALRHCKSMADFFGENRQREVALDWAVAAFELTNNELEYRELANLLLKLLWKSLPPPSKLNWTELSQTSADTIPDRTLGVTLLRVLKATESKPLPLELSRKFLEIIESKLPDIWGKIGAKRTSDDQNLTSMLQHLLTETEEQIGSHVRDAVTAPDLHRFHQFYHMLPRELSNKLAAAILNPFLPKAAIKTTLPSIFNAVEQIKLCSQSMLGEITQSCQHSLKIELEKFEKHGTLALVIGAQNGPGSARKWDPPGLQEWSGRLRCVLA